MGSLADESSDDDLDPVESPKIQAAIGLDPGWTLARSSVDLRISPLEMLAARGWWPKVVSSGPVAELLGRLWRHSVAVGFAARGLAREIGDPDPEAVAIAGQLCDLGRWAVAAIEPEWLLSWWRLEDPSTPAEGTGGSGRGPE